MAERSLRDKRGNIPVVIHRPSIVIGCYDEPLAGWTDTISAAGGPILGVGLGVLRYLKLNMEACLDIIPCDFVASQIIAASCYAASVPSDLHVIHGSSSFSNPLKLGDF